VQAGGKITDGESSFSAFCRELDEELGLALADDDARDLGCYSAPRAVYLQKRGV
jgi:8-oxo-dGTP pyrophosphatase MutT (NUDIX family)